MLAPLQLLRRWPTWQQLIDKTQPTLQLLPQPYFYSIISTTEVEGAAGQLPAAEHTPPRGICNTDMGLPNSKNAPSLAACNTSGKGEPNSEELGSTQIPLNPFSVPGTYADYTTRRKLASAGSPLFQTSIQSERFPLG